VMTGVVDSKNNYLYEFHQYLDSDSSGTNTVCAGTGTIGSQRIAFVTSWLRQHGHRGFLGEFAGANNANCQATVSDLLTYMEANSDVWVGWSWWSAGPWWGTYMFTLEPGTGNTDQPQMAWLVSHLAGGPSATGTGTGPATTVGTGTGTGTGAGT